MLKTMLGAAAATTLLMTLPAFAGDHRDHQAPSPERISNEAMTRRINDLGYDVHRLEMEHGRYEAHIAERKTGAIVKALFDGKDGELIRAESHQ